MSEPSAVSSQLERLRKQRAGLADFGLHAVHSDELDTLLHEATALVSDALDVDLVKVLELLPDRRTLLVRAGVNWKPGVVGKVTLSAGAESPGGYALSQGEPVVSRDITTEARFEIPALLIEHGVKSTVNVIIAGKPEPFGVLEVDAREHRDFDEDDVHFLQNYANLLAAAIERVKLHRALKDAADVRTILMQELQHRVNNIMANIRALARQTAASSATLDEFTTAFEGRIDALARTQDLLTGGRTDRITLRAIAQAELEAHGAEEGRRFTLHGPDVAFSPRIAQALGLVFHELSTNAVKYGALAVERGRIEVSWRVEPSGAQDQLRIRWRETGAEIGNTSPKKSVGSRIIEKSVPYMLGGRSELIFHPDGVECVLEFPLPNRGDAQSEGVRDGPGS